MSRPGQSCVPLLLAAVLACSGGQAGPTAAGEDLPLRIEIESGDDQTADVGTALEDLLVVRVTRGEKGPADAIPVSWTVPGGGARLAIKRPRTDSQGLAAASLFLIDMAGERTIRAEIVGGPSVTFSANATESGSEPPLPLKDPLDRRPGESIRIIP